MTTATQTLEVRLKAGRMMWVMGFSFVFIVVLVWFAWMTADPLWQINGSSFQRRGLLLRLFAQLPPLLRCGLVATFAAYVSAIWFIASWRLIRKVPITVSDKSILVPFPFGFSKILPWTQVKSVRYENKPIRTLTFDGPSNTVLRQLFWPDKVGFAFASSDLPLPALLTVLDKVRPDLAGTLRDQIEHFETKAKRSVVPNSAPVVRRKLPQKPEEPVTVDSRKWTG